MITPKELATALSDELKRIVTELEQIEAQEAGLRDRKTRLVVQRDGLQFTLDDVSRRSDKQPIRSPIAEVDERFRNMSVRQALHFLARARGRRLKATTALDELMSARFYARRESARNSVYSQFFKGEKKGEWKKAGRGVYEQVFDPFVPSANGHALLPDAGTKAGTAA